MFDFAGFYSRSLPSKAAPLPPAAPSVYDVAAASAECDLCVPGQYQQVRGRTDCNYCGADKGHFHPTNHGVPNVRHEEPSASSLKRSNDAQFMPSIREKLSRELTLTSRYNRLCLEEFRAPDPLSLYVTTWNAGGTKMPNRNMFKRCRGKRRERRSGGKFCPYCLFSKSHLSRAHHGVPFASRDRWNPLLKRNLPRVPDRE